MKRDTNDSISKHEQTGENEEMRLAGVCVYNGEDSKREGAGV